MIIEIRPASNGYYLTIVDGKHREDMVFEVDFIDENDDLKALRDLLAAVASHLAPETARRAGLNPSMYNSHLA